MLIVEVDTGEQVTFWGVLKNQRTNGPVNAHLISGATVSAKTSFTKFDIVLKWVKVNSGSSAI